MHRNGNRAALAAEVTSVRVFTALALLAGLFLLAASIGGAGEQNAASTSVTLPASQLGIEQLAGGPADRCVFASPGRKLCRWEMSGRLVRPITRGGIGDGDLVRIVCELPNQGGETGECRAHPEGESQLPAVAAAASPQDPFAAYATIGALSHVLGDIPDRCTTLGGAQACTWPLGAGADELAGTAQEGGDAQLRCVLPLDGSPRADGSCGVISPE